MIEFEAVERNQQVIIRKISLLIERYKDRLGLYDIIPVGNTGFLLQSERLKPIAYGDWFMFDYDDALVGTSEAKDKRFDLYKEYVLNLGIDTTDENLKRIIEKTDKFSRWESKEGFGPSYHANSHMSALNWATNELNKSAERKKNGEEIVMEDEVTRVEKTLDRIKNELNGEENFKPTDPFYFRIHDKKMILKEKITWSKGIETIFIQSMINPPYYEETITAAASIIQTNDSIQQVNIGVVTYGEPEYQLLKIFELLKNIPDLLVNQIWLSRIPKGRFIEELIKLRIKQRTKLDFGHPLGTHIHAIIIMDDSPKELSSILTAIPYLQENTGASLVAVRSRRTGTKEANTEWVGQTLFGEIDFRSGTITQKEVIKILQINRYLSLKNRYGENHSRVKTLAKNLYMFGITAEEIQNNS